MVKSVTNRLASWASLCEKLQYTVRKVIQFPRYNMKYRGKRDTTGNIPRSISFSPLHFILYRGKPITFGTVYTCLAMDVCEKGLSSSSKGMAAVVVVGMAGGLQNRFPVYTVYYCAIYCPRPRELTPSLQGINK